MEEEIKKEEQEEILEDVVFEEEEQNPRDLIKKLKEKIKTSDTEKQKYLENWQRDKADFVNARKDDERRNTEVIKFAKESLVDEIIPVLDSFELAFRSPSWNSVAPEWRTGVEYIHSQLKTVLLNNGLTEIDPLGVAFNPHEHQAIGTVESEDEEDDGKVLEVLQKGYKLNGKVIRTANVKIGERKSVA
ncbi:MAG: nucleotide exchange factor GrpE [Patescibacteria group bacterium]